MRNTIEQKLATHFGVKSAYTPIQQKVDSENRTVKAVGNTYFYIDSDLDMLVKGCCIKTINDKGPQSQAIAKIKHQSDHVLDTRNTVGRITVLDERNIEGKDVLYFESFIPETRKGNDDLRNYEEGLYDNHSIGFRYKNIILADRESTNEMERKAWDEYYPLALNPEKADEHGYFWVVKEIELFEISVVSFGANSLTPNLTGKSKDANDRLKTEILERIENISSQLKSSALSKESKKEIELESLQLKQIVKDLELFVPSKKSTPKESEIKDTKPKALINEISKQF